METHGQPNVPPSSHLDLGPAERVRLLAWLAGGVRDLDWTLKCLPAARWLETPPSDRADALGVWPAARHARHLALYEAHLSVPAVEAALAEPKGGTAEPDRLPFETEDAAWETPTLESAADVVAGWVRTLGEARFELLRRAEEAPDDAWPRLAWLLGRSYQHELEHLSALWKLALFWDRVGLDPQATTPSGLRLHPADGPSAHQ